MKDVPTQLDMRENTASSRRHASRPAMSGSPRPFEPSHSTESTDGRAQELKLSTKETFAPSLADPDKGPLGEEKPRHSALAIAAWMRFVALPLERVYAQSVSVPLAPERCTIGEKNEWIRSNKNLESNGKVVEHLGRPSLHTSVLHRYWTAKRDRTMAHRVSLPAVFRARVFYHTCITSPPPLLLAKLRIAYSAVMPAIRKINH
jgi:hypothetical protein